MGMISPRQEYDAMSGQAMAMAMISSIARQGYHLMTISCIGYDITQRRLPDKDNNAMSRKATISRKDEMQWK